MSILLFSPVRTGSTLVYNIIKELYSFKIYKNHNININNLNEFKFIFITYRHPCDIILSMINSQEELITDKNVCFYTNAFLKCGGKQLIQNYRFLKQNKKILLLKYELFYNNFDYIFDNIEDKFKLNVHLIKRNNLKTDLCIDSVLNKIKHFQSFKEFDKDTHLHGLHISKNNGNIYQYKTNFSKEQIQMIDKILLNDLKNEYLNFMKQNNYN